MQQQQDASDTSTREILSRLQQACSKQEQLIKELREPLMPQSATNATQRSTTAQSEAVSSVGDGLGSSGAQRPSQFHVACPRRWNQQFQLIVDKPATSPEQKRTAVNAFLAEYEAAASTIVEQFLAKYLGDEDEEGKPTAAAAQLQWATATQIGAGQFLTISLLDCQDSSAMALVAKDYRAQLTVLSQNISFSANPPLVRVFPKALVRFRGRALVVTAETPRVGDLLAAWDCPELVLAMAVAADTLNLSPYYLPSDDEDLLETMSLLDANVSPATPAASAASPATPAWLASVGAVLKYPHWGSVSAKARRCADGRLYFQSLLDFFPHFPPAKNERVKNHLHTMYIRPEAVAASKEPLSSGAFILFGTKDSTARNAAVRECTRHVCMNSVITVAQTIDAVGSPTSAELRKILHDLGVNVSLLAMILTYLKRGEARALVLSEMVARVSRDYLLREMSRHMELDDSRKVVSEFFAELSDLQSLTALWHDELAPRLCKKFPGFATFFGSGSASYGGTLALVDKEHLLRAIPPLVGVRFANGVTTAGTSSFHYCVTDFRPVVKPMPLPRECFAGLGLVADATGAVAEICNSMSLAQPVDTPRTSMTLSYSILANVRRGRRASRAASLSSSTAPEEAEDEEQVSELHTKLSVYHAFERSGSQLAASDLLDKNDNTNSSLAPDVGRFIENRTRFLGTAFGGLPINNTIHNIFTLLEAATVCGASEAAKAHLTAAKTIAEKLFARGKSSSGGGGEDGRPTYLSGGLIEARIHVGLGLALEAIGDVAGGIKALENAFAIATDLNMQTDPSPAVGASSNSNSARSRPTSSASQARRTSNSSRGANTPCGGESLAAEFTGGSSGYTMEAAEIATLLAGLMERHGLHSEATPHYEYALAALVFFLGELDGAVCTANNNLAVNFYSLGKYTEAENLYREDLRVSEIVFGPNSVNVAQTLNNLACLLDRVERGDESEALYLRDIRITSKALGEEHPDVATSRNNLGSNYLKRGKLQDAENLLRQALATRNKIYGARSVEVAEVLNNVGALYKSQNKRPEAVDTWREAIAIYEERLGPTCTALLNTLENLHLLVEDMGDYAEAERLMEKMQEVKRVESETYFATKRGA